MMRLVDAQEKSLEQLLEQYETQALPDLVTEPSSWQKMLDEWYEAWVQPIVNWIRSWFSGIDKIDNHYNLPWKTIIIGALIVVVIWGLYVLARYLIRQNQPKVLLQAQDAPSYRSYDLQDAYLKAEKDGDYALAARLFWKLFLYNNNLRLSQTPLEYFGEHAHVYKMYTLMFSYSAAQEDFDQFKSSLNRGSSEA